MYSYSSSSSLTRECVSGGAAEKRRGRRNESGGEELKERGEGGGDRTRPNSFQSCLYCNVLFVDRMQNSSRGRKGHSGLFL